jgi:hypothetical protein
MHHRFSTTLCANARQETTGGIFFHKYLPHLFPPRVRDVSLVR